MGHSVEELRAIAAKHLRKARESTGDEREFELYLARAYKFLADDEERRLDSKLEPS